MNVALIAEEAAGARTIALVHGRGHRITRVHATPGGTAATAAARLGLAVEDPGAVTEPAFAAALRGEGADLLLNVHGLRIVHPAALEAPRLGAFNLHPGPLPEYAGLNAPSWAVLRGEATHAVTVHRMAAEVDAGPVAFAARYPVGPDATGLSVSLDAVRHGLPLVERLLEAAARGPEAIPAEPQDPAHRRWHGAAAPFEGRLPWWEPARVAEAFVRACDYGPFPSPWGRPLLDAGDAAYEVLAAGLTGEPAREAPGTVTRGPGDALTVATADERLSIRRMRRVA